MASRYVEAGYWVAGYAQGELAIKSPQTDLPVGLRGGADTWDQPQASVVLDEDWFTAPTAGPTLKYWAGSAWLPKPLKWWNGSAFVNTGVLKYWNGSTWVAA